MSNHRTTSNRSQSTGISGNGAILLGNYGVLLSITLKTAKIMFKVLYDTLELLLGTTFKQQNIYCYLLVFKLRLRFLNILSSFDGGMVLN
ncbi:MAG: hypothetical protein HC815_05660 [Richelia sp. RM1_1_1]|nr:hypothetical protein [Richelia sp. RM1_1_1]